MKKIMFMLAFFMTEICYADFHYCTGKVVQLVTRATAHETQIAIENMNGSARINYGGGNFSDMHDRQFSMLLAAYISGDNVTLEFLSNDDVSSCNDSHTGVPIRFVRLSR